MERYAQCILEQGDENDDNEMIVSLQALYGTIGGY